MVWFKFSGLLRFIFRLFRFLFLWAALLLVDEAGVIVDVTVGVSVMSDEDSI